MKTYASIDLGAGSGRVIVAQFDGSKITTQVVNRFDNTPFEWNGHIYWNIPALLTGIREGLAKAAAQFGPIASVGVDTWGVDYALLDKQGRLLGLPVCYRDIRNSDARMDKILSDIGREELYKATGIQFINFNTVFQFKAEVEDNAPLVDLADKVLFIPDLINYALCSVAANEYTIASTSGLIDLATRDWSAAFLDKIGFRKALLSRPVMPGTVLGNVKGIPGLENTPVIAVGGHDTASAVAAVPADSSTKWGYLATGTWALLGVEINEPIINEASYRLNYTHEGGVDGSIRFLKNCTGMWMIQELRRAWTLEDGSAPSYDSLMNEAEKSEAFRSLINPDWAPFQSPGDMPRKIADFCRQTGQKVPETRGQFYRAAMEGIVLRYKDVWGELETLTGVKRDVLHAIGGATRDTMHCRFTTDALGVNLACGPVEGASMGNAIAQMIGLGDITSLSEGRQLIRSSIEMQHYSPSSDVSAWDDAYARWKTIARR